MKPFHLKAIGPGQSGFSMLSAMMAIGITTIGIMALMQFMSFKVASSAINRNKQSFQDVGAAFESVIGSAMTSYMSQTSCNTQTFGQYVNNEPLGPWGVLTLVTSRPIFNGTPPPAVEIAASRRCVPQVVPTNGNGTSFHFCTYINVAHGVSSTSLPVDSFLRGNGVFAEVRGDLVDLVHGTPLTCAQYLASGSSGISVNTSVYWNRIVGTTQFYESSNDSFYVNNSTNY